MLDRSVPRLPVTVTPSARPRSGPRRANLIDLQRQAGNRAVAGLIADPRAHPIAVQRFVDDLWEGIADAAGGIAEVASDVATGFGKAVTETTAGLRDISHGLPAEQAFVKRLILSGVTDADALTQLVYATRHPTTAMRRLDPKDPADKPLIKEWKKLKKDLVEPSLKRYKAKEELTKDQIERRIRMATGQAERGGEAEARTLLEADIRTTTKGSVKDWFSKHVPNARFLGVPIGPSRGSSVGGVHTNVVALLAKAEENLRAEPDLAGLDGLDLADALGVDGIGGLRPPLLATGGTRPSLHCYGLAIDINASRNPFIGLHGRKAPKMIERATLLVRHEAFKITADPKGRDVETQWQLIAGASSDVQVYLDADAPTLERLVDELAIARPSLPAKQRTLSFWQGNQKSDRALKGRGDFTGGRDPRKQGIMDLDLRLVRALTAAGMTWGGMFRSDKDLMHFDDRSLFRKTTKDDESDGE